jgi:hypothetical protein
MLICVSVLFCVQAQQVYYYAKGVVCGPLLLFGSKAVSAQHMGLFCQGPGPLPFARVGLEVWLQQVCLLQPNS